MTYAGHVLRGSSRISVVLMLEGKTNSVRTRDRPRKNWIDDLKE